MRLSNCHPYKYPFFISNFQFSIHSEVLPKQNHFKKSKTKQNPRKKKLNWRKIVKWRGIFKSRLVGSVKMWFLIFSNGNWGGKSVIEKGVWLKNWEWLVEAEGLDLRFDLAWKATKKKGEKIRKQGIFWWGV